MFNQSSKQIWATVSLSALPARPEISRIGETRRGRIGVWDWKPIYSETTVLDGTQWSLEIRHNGRAMSSEGDNDYPGGVGAEYSDDSAFGQFLKALAQLIGVKEFYETES